MEVIGDQKLFGYILQNIFFCVQQKKLTHTGLEQLKGSKLFFIFGWTIPLSSQTEINTLDFESQSI